MAEPAGDDSSGMAEPAGDESSGRRSPQKREKPEAGHVHTAEELAAMSGPDSLAPLSYTLAHVVGVEEEELVRGLRQTDVAKWEAAFVQV